MAYVLTINYRHKRKEEIEWQSRKSGRSTGEMSAVTRLLLPRLEAARLYAVAKIWKKSARVGMRISFLGAKVESITEVAA